ncbi:hypothetical protein OSB04_016531 [Centaurea solstitialis]|uniref:F-box domain-containing protein n=1 Tax=Centaurea solstitialis TaxID=347529 RepID=A0AA38WL61_9ASTR|nr:hypothetical protein OSB04_016531 [Centaurea solstitialis]
MEALPAELTIDILSRLPVKTIVHCKLVCKKWRNLVLDSFPVNRHLSGSVPIGIIIHHNPRIYLGGSLIVPNDPGTLKWVKIEDKVDHHNLHYNRLLSLDLNLAPILQNTQMGHVGSVNGLICLRQYYPDLNFDDTYICNPVTREYMILPRQRSRRDSFAGVVYGFGMSSSLTGEYKVVQTFQTEVLEAEVYTLGKGQWRSLGPVSVPIPYCLNTFHQFYGPFLNNHCHWIVSDNEICTFDLDKETFQLFPSPPVKQNRFRRQSLAILKGCLCKLDTYYFKLTIWVMKEYGIKNTWHKENFNQYPSMEDLPIELTVDIISRLPVNTIIHCKRVCKKWRNLVSDSSFVNLHHSKSHQTGLVIYRRKDYKDPGILEWVEIVDCHHHPFRTLDLNLAHLAPILQNSKINRMVSVNGLICLWQISPGLKFDDTYVCNPVTREIIILPRQQQKYRQGFSSFFYGFGVSSLTGEYKVVKLSQPGVSLETNVYTLGTRQWRNLGQVPYPIRASNGSFLNDHFHWIV